MRKKLIAGNWKLNLDRKAARELAVAVKNGARSASAHVEVAVAPVATAFAEVKDGLGGASVLMLGQNCYQESTGAFTGEISPPLLKDAGCAGCIIGHSERRQLFGETDAGVHAKLKALLEVDMVPVLCVGETLEDRERGSTESVVLGQLSGAVGDLSADALPSLVIAYEPVWAIGTGRTASPSDAQDVHEAIRGWVSAQLGPELANSVRILYGGSVKPENAAELLGQADIDGALVGGASLKAESFLAIIAAAGN